MVSVLVLPQQGQALQVALAAAASTFNPVGGPGDRWPDVPSDNREDQIWLFSQATDGATEAARDHVQVTRQGGSHLTASCPTLSAQLCSGGALEGLLPRHSTADSP